MSEKSNEFKTMRAALGKDYGDIDEMINVNEGVPMPRISDIPKKDRKNWIIIETLAVSLAPGDCRVLSGKTRELQGPPSLPYIPGGDVCGIVVESNEPSISHASFQPGDIIVARFHERPFGALGEYAAVHTGVCDRVPPGVTPEGAASLGSSGIAALCVADCIKEKDRVIIFGARGGVGSHLCQLARVRGASYIVGVSRDPMGLMAPPLSCDRAVDYTKEDAWVSIKEFSEEPFDVVVDLAGGCWQRVLEGPTGANSIVKPAKDGGRFLTLTPDSPIFEAHSIWSILMTFLFPALWRAFYTRIWSRRKLPTYSFVVGLPSGKEFMTRVLTKASEGKLVPCIDPDGPFEFTTKGVRDAFRLQESRHVRGKVVIQVAKI